VLAKRLFSGLTTITPMMKEEICSEFSIKPSRVGTWASGVSPTIFDPNEWRARGNELRAKLGLSGKFVVFYHGSLSDNRGISETIEATKIILKNHSGIALFLLGSGPFASELKFIIKKENLQHNVFIHNAVKYEQVPAFISMCDVGIIPLPNYSIWRPQSPLKLLEYLAMKKVVIATDLPAHRNVLDNQKCGIYLSSVNPQIIARGIEYALINKDKLGNWGDSGRKIILSNYTWEKVAGDLEHFLLGLRQNALYKS
jgi:glycosyltransferase involved in cell wall biosynthesis